MNFLHGGHSSGVSSSPQTSPWQPLSWPSLASLQPRPPSPPPTSTPQSSSPQSSGEVSPHTGASLYYGWWQCWGKSLTVPMAALSPSVAQGLLSAACTSHCPSLLQADRCGALLDVGTGSGDLGPTDRPPGPVPSGHPHGYLRECPRGWGPALHPAA